MTTDGPPPEGIADAVYAMDTEGPGRALPRCSTSRRSARNAARRPSRRTATSLFLSVQHPGDLRIDDNEDATSIADAGTNWPDFADGMPARPSLVVITRQGGGVVGS